VGAPMTNTVETRLAAAQANEARLDRTVKALFDEGLLVSHYSLASIPAAERVILGPNFEAWKKVRANPDNNFAHVLTVKARGNKTAQFIAFADGTTFPCHHDPGLGALARSEWAAKEFTRRYNSTGGVNP
jgi:hypothetical protein